MIAFAFVRRLHFKGIASRIRLSQPKREDLVPLGSGWEIASLLIFVAPSEHRIGADGDMPGEKGAHPRAFTANTRQRFQVSDGIDRTTAVCLGKRHSQKTILLAERQ